MEDKREKTFIFTSFEEYCKPSPEGTTLEECVRLNEANLPMLQSQPGYEEWRRNKKRGMKEFKL